MSKVSWIFILVFGLVGAGAGIGEYFILASHFRFRADAVRVDGELVGYQRHRGGKGGTVYAPRVRYVVPAPEGGAGVAHEVVGSVRSSWRGWNPGDKVPVWYRSSAPEEARIGSFMEQWFVPLLLGVFALLFGGIATGFLLAELRRIRTWRWLEHSGMSVQARIVEVDRDSSVKVNGRSPWVIRAQWQHPVTQTVHVFTSERLWFDPAPFVAGREQIGVRVDADDPRRHRVDIDWLPKQG
ncbi:MAG: DUF3592 domain-containing protein [Xanthomonadales bacterium]|nr:hypothetical protein [Xanthomonadales bacterium]MCC6593545.1 DUF3592 domain-containing protein [Xanthomonadales bacterium]MCE7930994.1 DUF3592 domain-containing protein [Xanthomonadales bacterium PRO6]